jgi:hypothetical protein
LAGAFQRIVEKVLSNPKFTGARMLAYGTLWALTKALIGVSATYTLGRAYINEMRDGDPTNVHINRAIARMTDEDVVDGIIDYMDEYRRRPDIIDHTLGEQQVYEIKSLGESNRGVNTVQNYASLLNQRYGVPYQLGTWSPRQPYYTIDLLYGIPIPGLKIEAWLSSPGVIVYKSAGNEDTLLQTVVLTEMVTQMAYGAVKLYVKYGVGAVAARNSHGVSAQIGIAAMSGGRQKLYH